MDQEVYDIIKTVLQEDNLNEEYQKRSLLIKEITENENIDKKTDILKVGINFSVDLYNDVDARKKLTINTINLISLIEYKLFFDSVLNINPEDMMTFIDIYNMTKITGKLHDNLNSFLKLLYVINDTLENSIKQAYYKHKDEENAYFHDAKLIIEEAIDSYSDDSSNWNKINI